MAFFEDLYSFGFCDEINFKNPQKVLENTNKEASQEIAIPMKNSSKIMNRINVQKITFFCLTVLLEGGDKI